MKKILSLILALALTFSLAACGSNTDSQSGGQQNTELQDFEKELGNPGTLRVGISPDYEPFDFYDENGNVTGFDVDMTNELAKYLGTEEAPYAVEFIPMEFSTIVSALGTGTIDVGISGFTYDPERDCIFSEPYLNSAQVIVVNKESGITKEEDLAGATMAAGLNTVGANVIKTLAETYEGIELVNPGDYTVMFESLKAGAISAVVCDEAVAANYAAANDNLVILDNKYEVQEMSVLIKKGNDALAAKINEAVSKFVESEAYNTLKEKYGV